MAGMTYFNNSAEGEYDDEVDPGTEADKAVKGARQAAKARRTGGLPASAVGQGY